MILDVITKYVVKLPRPWSKMRRFSSVPSLLGAKKNGTGMEDFSGGGLTLEAGVDG
jgi:hypothetical protein